MSEACWMQCPSRCGSATQHRLFDDDGRLVAVITESEKMQGVFTTHMVYTTHIMNAAGTGKDWDDAYWISVAAAQKHCEGVTGTAVTTGGGE